MQLHRDWSVSALVGSRAANGAFYLVDATFAGTIVLLFTSLPGTFVAVLAGLALIGAITSNIVTAAEATDHREASIITFMATASGMSLFGLGTASWGGLAYLVLHKTELLPRRRAFGLDSK